MNLLLWALLVEVYYEECVLITQCTLDQKGVYEPAIIGYILYENVKS